MSRGKFGRILAVLVVLLGLTAAFFAGGPIRTAPAFAAFPAVQRERVTLEKPALRSDAAMAPTAAEETADTPAAQTPQTPPQAEAEPVEETTEPSSQTPQTSQTSQTSQTPQEQDLTCTLAISCAVLAADVSVLPEEKQTLVPEDGWLLHETTVTFTEGESVFDVLQRVTKEQGILMEASFTPGYNSSYVEGIGNLYEFDAGPLSGWTYQVNGVSPGVGSSSVLVCAGDQIVWMYTCDLGQDVGSSLPAA